MRRFSSRDVLLSLNFLAATKRSWIEIQPSPRVRKAGGPANVLFAGLFQRPRIQASYPAGQRCARDVFSSKLAERPFD